MFDETPLEKSAKLRVVIIRNLDLDKKEKLKLAASITKNIENLDQLAHFIKWISIESDNKKDDALYSKSDLKRIVKEAVDNFKRGAE